MNEGGPLFAETTSNSGHRIKKTQTGSYLRSNIHGSCGFTFMVLESTLKNAKGEEKLFSSPIQCDTYKPWQ